MGRTATWWCKNLCVYDYRTRKKENAIRNVKMLTLAQLATMIVVFVGVFVYNSLRPAVSHKVYGVVEGILYNPETPSALIDGQIIKEGDEIYGVNIISISRNKVEFENCSRKWEQRVQERPNRAWTESEEAQEYSDAIDK